MIRGIKSPEQVSSRRAALTLMNAFAAAAFSTVAILGAGENRARDPFYIFLWFVWMALTIGWVFGVPGYLRWSAAERAIINDELVQSHQAKAAKAGLVVALAGLGMLSISGIFQCYVPVWSPAALVSLTVVSTAIVFAWLERRDG